MAKLSLWLPPFAPDYSGAAAVLFDLNTVTAMHDASGCTGNYTGYDEPRWYGSQSAIYCSGLREIDAVLGNDNKLIKKMEAAARDIKPDLIGLIGSPVPMVIGSDLKGIAEELECNTGIPGFGFDTTGTAYYDKGAFMAASALLDRFAAPAKSEDRRVNILGALPMDYYKGEELRLLRKLLEERGYQVGMTFAMNYTLKELKETRRAEVNIAVSRFGYLTAKYIEKRYGIPYLCGFPAGDETKEEWFEKLEQVRREKQSVIFHPAEKETAKRQLQALVIGEQVMANAVRGGLHEVLGNIGVTVGCLYGLEQALSRDGDLNLTDEKEIKTAVNDERYQLIIADPFLKVLLEEGSTKQFVPFAQYAVSSKLGIKEQALVTGTEFNQWFRTRYEEDENEKKCK